MILSLREIASRRKTMKIRPSSQSRASASYASAAIGKLFILRNIFSASHSKKNFSNFFTRLN